MKWWSELKQTHVDVYARYICTMYTTIIIMIIIIIIKIKLLCVSHRSQHGKHKKKKMLNGKKEFILYDYVHALRDFIIVLYINN